MTPVGTIPRSTIANAFAYPSGQDGPMQRLWKERMTVFGAAKVRKLLAKGEADLKNLEAERVKLVETHGPKGDDGTVLPFEQWSGEDKSAFLTAFGEMFAVEETWTEQKVTLKELGNATITPEDAAILAPFLDDTDA